MVVVILSLTTYVVLQHAGCRCVWEWEIVFEPIALQVLQHLQGQRDRETYRTQLQENYNIVKKLAQKVRDSNPAIPACFKPNESEIPIQSPMVLLVEHCVHMAQQGIGFHLKLFTYTNK